jgi:murein hydrolase activator
MTELAVTRALTIATLLALAAARLAYATTPVESVAAERKLANVRAQIANLSAQLANELKRRDVQAAALREAELAITETRRRLDSLREKGRKLERERAALLIQQTAQRKILAVERDRLARQVRAAYTMGHGEQLKLLLNQSDPARTGRMLMYYRYFAATRARQVTTIREAMDRLAATDQDITAQSENLSALRAEARQQLAGLALARTQRSEALAVIEGRVTTGHRTLGALKADAGALESLLENLRQITQDFPAESPQSFAGMKGRLHWPVHGRIATQYGAPKAGGYKWDGVLIDSDPGAKVKAAFFGRVIYADWLQGQGLLLIVEHQGGYLSLYGHNEVLYKSAGDWVGPTDTLASLGEAGPKPQLYLEIRQGRKPLDPRQWFAPGP